MARKKSADSWHPVDAWSINRKGFTLIEVVVSIVLVSVLLTGVVAAWNLVNSMYFGLALKQKAIIALNSQTERLTALYRWCNGFTPAGAQGNNNNRFTLKVPGSNTIYYYDNDSNKSCTYNGSTNDFIKVINTDFRGANGDDNDWGKVFYRSDIPNIVFIDRNRNIVAKFAWEESSVGSCGLCSTSPGSCTNLPAGAGGAVCLNIHLVYPFRWDGTNPVIDSGLGSQRQLDVQTISARAQ